MNLEEVINILLGSTFGLILRFFIQKNLSSKIAVNFDNTLIVNVLASLFLGIFTGLSPTNKNLILFFSVGFLGCFSTFSSFIYMLFSLIQKRKYLKLFYYYVEVLVLTFLFFCLGHFISLVFKNWIKNSLLYYY